MVIFSFSGFKIFEMLYSIFLSELGGCDDGFSACCGDCTGCTPLGTSRSSAVLGGLGCPSNCGDCTERCITELAELRGDDVN